METAGPFGPLKVVIPGFLPLQLLPIKFRNFNITDNCYRDLQEVSVLFHIYISVQERHGPVGAGPEEGHKNDRKDGAPLL